jgi:hypothetical protein
MNLAAHVLVSNGAQLAGIWLVLIGLAVASLLALNAEPHQGVVVRAAQALSDYLDDRRDERLRRAEAARYAREIVVAAEAATVTVQRRREQWHEAQQQQDDAWAACQDADERVATARRGAAFDSYALAYLPVHFVVRERYLRTAATAAHRRGELSGPQLVDALVHRNGWDATLHPASQDVVLARLGREHRRLAYQRTVAAERTAWHEAEIAVVAARTLRHEAAIAVQATAARPAPPLLRRPAWLTVQLRFSAPAVPQATRS